MICRGKTNLVLKKYVGFQADAYLESMWASLGHCFWGGVLLNTAGRMGTASTSLPVCRKRLASRTICLELFVSSVIYMQNADKFRRSRYCCKRSVSRFGNGLQFQKWKKDCHFSVFGNGVGGPIAVVRRTRAMIALNRQTPADSRQTPSSNCLRSKWKPENLFFWYHSFPSLCTSYFHSLPFMGNRVTTMMI